MRQQLVLVAAVEVDDGAAVEARAAQRLPVGAGEYAGDEVFPQQRIVQPAFFLDRQFRPCGAECLGVETACGCFDQAAIVIVQPDPLQTAGW
ncbi:hypothetical protein D9M70_627470 [compost metagenome]